MEWRWVEYAAAYFLLLVSLVIEITVKKVTNDSAVLEEVHDVDMEETRKLHKQRVDKDLTKLQIRVILISSIPVDL